MTPREHGSVQFGRTTVAYAVVRSPRRVTLALAVCPDLTVEVKAPTGASVAQIERAVRSRAEWIIQKQDAFRRLQQVPRKTFVSGETFRYLGRQYVLKVVPSNIPRPLVTMKGRQLRVEVPRSPAREMRQALVRKALQRWYVAKAKAYLPAMVEICARRQGIAPPPFTVRDLLMRWGSCPPSGRILFNWRAVMARRGLVEYVVAHELVHLQVPDHSRRFWEALERCIPNSRLRQMELDRLGGVLGW